MKGSQCSMIVLGESGTQAMFSPHHPGPAPCTSCSLSCNLSTSYSSPTQFIYHWEMAVFFTLFSSKLAHGHYGSSCTDNSPSQSVCGRLQPSTQASDYSVLVLILINPLPASFSAHSEQPHGAGDVCSVGRVLA